MNEILFSGIKVNELLERISHLLDSKLGTPKKETPKSGYLSRKEVAHLLKITLPTLHDWTKLGWLKAYKIGTRVLYKPDEVQLSVETLSSLKHKKGGFRHA